MQSSNASETIGISNSGQTRILNEPINDSNMITNLSEDEVLILSRALQSFDLSGNKIVNASADLLALASTISRLKISGQENSTRVEISRAIIDLKYKIVQLDYPASVAENLCLLFAIVIDEFILTSEWGSKTEWANRTLVADLFGFRDGGDRFYKISERALMQPRALKDFIEVVYLFLKLGYLGKYTSEGEYERDALLERIENSIDTQSSVAEKLKIGREVKFSKPPRKKFVLVQKFIFGLIIVLFSYSIYFYTNMVLHQSKRESYQNFSSKLSEKKQFIYVYSSIDGKTNPRISQKNEQ